MPLFGTVSLTVNTDVDCRASKDPFDPETSWQRLMSFYVGKLRSLEVELHISQLHWDTEPNLGGGPG